jgi:hypothetical protein
MALGHEICAVITLVSTAMLRNYTNRNPGD